MSKNVKTVEQNFKPQEEIRNFVVVIAEHILKRKLLLLFLRNQLKLKPNNLEEDPIKIHPIL